MNSGPILAGLRILIAEDNYVLAYCAKHALSNAGAEVVGPFADEAEAVEAIHDGRLNAAVIDVNFGSGPSFEMARALRSADVPFIFLTGYDQRSKTPEFADVQWLVKPIDESHIIGALANLFAPR